MLTLGWKVAFTSKATGQHNDEEANGLAEHRM